MVNYQKNKIRAAHGLTKHLSEKGVLMLVMSWLFYSQNY